MSTLDFVELHGLFGNILERALDLVDRNQIKIYTPTSRNRQLVEIFGQNGAVYKLFPNINYCPCKAFKNFVLLTTSEYTCKHVLATRLAIILQKQTEEVISEDAFKFLISDLIRQCANIDESASEP